jgi:hypothetical protein
MMHVRLVRSVDTSGRNGPQNGQYALQKALRQRMHRDISWLSIGGEPRPDELPWFWCWLDRPAAVGWLLAGRTLVQGPNTLFLDSRRPRSDALEQTLLDTQRCRLMFTESEWYRQLIQRHRGPRSQAPIVLWPYPIDPRPGGPIDPAEYDLLIYAKDRDREDLVETLTRHYRRCCVLQYGQFHREELWEAARRSRACCYLSSDDRGPLALAEILLCGCPTVGIPTGAPFVQPGRTGLLLDRWDRGLVMGAIRECLELPRDGVAAIAAEQFDTERIVATVLEALDRARRQ